VSAPTVEEMAAVYGLPVEVFMQATIIRRESILTGNEITWNDSMQQAIHEKMAAPSTKGTE
jgi:hypothetical protein